MSIDQAFVQAFARQNRNANPASDGELHVDPSVADSTQIWVDPIENEMMRADAGSEPQIPQPHVAPMPSPVASTPAPATPAPAQAVQGHVHTAYVYAETSQQAPTEVVPGEPATPVVPAAPDMPAQPIVEQRVDLPEAIAPPQSIERTEPTQITPTVEPVASQPIAPTPPTAPAEPVASAQPTAPTQPVAPAEPIATPEPVAPTIVEQRIDTPEPSVPAPATKVAQPAPTTTETPLATSPEPVSVEAQTDTTESKETESEQVQAPPIQPVWEVDSFDVPNSVSDLFFEEALFQLVAKRLHDAVNDGLRTMMVTSAKSGEGRSTIAIGMAMAAAASGLSVALIDGDVHEPTLIEDLRLDLDYGWLDAIRGGLPLDQVAVFSVEDGLTFIPLLPAPSQSSAATDYEIKRLLNSLQGQFDLIVIDAPVADSTTIETYAAQVDSAVVARDGSRTDIGTVNEMSYRLRECGLKGIGIVENFS